MALPLVCSNRGRPAPGRGINEWQRRGKRMTIRPWMTALVGVSTLTVWAGLEPTPIPQPPKEKLSYALGVDLGRNLKQQAVSVDAEAIANGLRDALTGAKTQLSEEEIGATLSAFRAELKRQQMEVRQNEAPARARAQAMKNKQAGEEFLAANKTKDGVVALPSGLQYRILKAGEGKKPSDADTVVCRYRGTLVDGTEFDSTERTGQPAAFKVSQVIPGWREALKLMPVGSKWQLFVPSELGYGERGAGREIGPNAALVFEVELLEIK